MSDIEIFVITNGRKTFDYALRALRDQTCQKKITIIQDMLWVDALNECVRRCKSEFFVRVDDDMLLHKYAIRYYVRAAQRIPKRCGVYMCRLWEDWSSKPISGLRMYRTETARNLGFRANRLGKVDKVFRKDMSKYKQHEIKDKAIVGIHCLSDVADQKHYRSLWRDKNSRISSSDFANTFDNLIHPMTKTIPEQYALLDKMRKINSRYKTAYADFIRKQRAHEQ